MERRTILKIMLVLAMIGAADSAYLINVHYSENAFFCDLNAKFNCQMVNKSEYAEFLGFPVAGVGLTGYLLIGLLALGLMKPEWLKKRRLDSVVTDKSTFIIVLAGFTFSAYLTYLEFFVIEFLCLYCLISQAIILLLLILAIFLFRKSF